MSQTQTPDHAPAAWGTTRLGRMPVEYELCMSLHWLSSLRWVAGGAVIVATWVASTLLSLGLNTTELYATGVAILAYNFAFQRWLTQIQCDLTGISTSARRLARVQIAVDWIAMASLIHFSGGIESPAILYFFFHTTLSAILLSARDTFLFTGLATLLLSTTAWLEYAEVLPHQHVRGLLPTELYALPLYVFSVLFFFASAVFVSAYLATRTTRRLRAREGEMVQLGQDLQRAIGQVAALYESAQAVSSTLELQEVLDRLTRSTTNVMRVKGCTIRLLQETSTELCLASTYGLREAYLQKGCLLVDQNPLVQQVLQGEIVAVPDISADARLQYPAEAAAEGIRATLTAPLTGKSGPLGIIRVYCDRVQCFTAEDEQFLRAMASHGSIAIENAMAYEAIQHLEEAKRKFVLLVTHELRSPIGVVHSLLKTLTGGYAGHLSTVQTDIVGRALRRNEFLQTLIDDLLDVAAGKAGLRRTTQMAPVDLAEIVRRIHDRYQAAATDKQIDFRLNLPEEFTLTIAADGEEIDRAVTNLVSNAVKYTPEGGMVQLTLERHAGAARLAVTDSGIGISDNALPHLFEEFYRAPNAKEQVKQGTGLGLVITKDIVTRYGGSIRVSSALGKGSTFTVMLPLMTEGALSDTAPTDALSVSTGPSGISVP